jgi:protein-disulfide isomerase
MSLKPPVSATDHLQGNEKALVELVEYGDYQCPYCGQAYPIIKRVQKNLGDDLKFVFRNFPLSEIHEHAMTAAVASEAAGLYHKFWEMHDLLFEHQYDLSLPHIMTLAAKAGLDPALFKTALGNEGLIKKVEADFESGVRSGVNGTPTFYINGKKYNEDWDERTLTAHLKAFV